MSGTLGTCRAGRWISIRPQRRPRSPTSRGHQAKQPSQETPHAGPPPNAGGQSRHVRPDLHQQARGAAGHVDRAAVLTREAEVRRQRRRASRRRSRGTAGSSPSGETIVRPPFARGSAPFGSMVATHTLPSASTFIESRMPCPGRAAVSRYEPSSVCGLGAICLGREAPSGERAACRSRRRTAASRRARARSRWARREGRSLRGWRTRRASRSRPRSRPGRAAATCPSR